jgi:hypothetical protein
MTTLRRARRTVLLPRNSCPGSKRGCEKALESMSAIKRVGLATGSTVRCCRLAHIAMSSPRRSSTKAIPELDQSGPEPAISMLCDETGYPFGPRAIFPRTKFGVTGDLPSVVEALPIADLAANDYAA